jgi:putative transposase
VVGTHAYALNCYRYIELNPVRAGLVARAADYPWSSYWSNADAHAGPSLCAHDAYVSLGDSEGSRKAAYRSLLEGPLPEEDIEAIRKATRGGYPVGEQRPPRGRRPRNQNTPQLV